MPPRMPSESRGDADPPQIAAKTSSKPKWLRIPRRADEESTVRRDAFANNSANGKKHVRESHAGPSSGLPWAPCGGPPVWPRR
eukprot:3214187-Pyramimonas_sp.AAC.1